MKPSVLLPVLLLLFAGLFFTYCENGAAATSVQPLPSDESRLLITGIDRSGTTAGITRFDTQHLRAICMRAIRLGLPLVIFCRVIADPDPADMHWVNIAVETPLPAQASIFQTQDRRVWLDSLRADNVRRVDHFLNDCAADLARYASLSRYTDLQAFYTKSKEILALPQYATYTKTVFVQTDGRHDLGHGETVICPDFGADVQFYTCHWSADRPCPQARNAGTADEFVHTYFLTNKTTDRETHL